MFKEPPINDNTIIRETNKFVQTWIKWFQSIKTAINSLIDSVDILKLSVAEMESVLGWGYWQDSQYTSASPLVINNTVTQITINGLGPSTNTTYLPDGVSFFNTTTSRITPENIGDSYVLRLDLRAKSGTNNVSFDVEIDIGSPSPPFVETFSIIKGINTEHRYGVSIPIFCLDTFVANGGQIKIRTTNNINFYSFGIFVSRTHKG